MGVYRLSYWVVVTQECVPKIWGKGEQIIPIWSINILQKWSAWKLNRCSSVQILTRLLW